VGPHTHLAAQGGSGGSFGAIELCYAAGLTFRGEFVRVTRLSPCPSESHRTSPPRQIGRNACNARLLRRKDGPVSPLTENSGALVSDIDLDAANAVIRSMSLETNQKKMIDSSNGSAISGGPCSLSYAGPARTAARCEGNMRKALVTLSGAGFIASLIVPSCVVEKKAADDGTGGSVFNTGGSGPILSGGASSQGGASVGGAPSTSESACPGLLEKFQQNPADVCSTSELAAQYNSINMLIVLDKSGSMKDIASGESKTKWAGAIDALKAALDPTETLVSYGFMLYPYSTPVAATSCELPDGAAAVNIPVAPASESVPAINDLMANTAPGGGTPTAAALAAAYDYYTKGAGVGLTGQKYVLLVTDGGPNCDPNITCGPDTCTANLDKSGSCGTGVANCCDPSLSTAKLDTRTLCLDDAQVISQLDALRAADINTFLIGIPGTEAYADYLDTFAEAGGKAVVGKDRKYYNVKNEQGLVDAFKTITTFLVHDCVVPLKEAPPDLNKVNVAVDCVELPQKTGDAVNWEWQPDITSIVIKGTKCDVIQNVGVKRIDVVNGCATIIQL
jgi:hypothetical protein